MARKQVVQEVMEDNKPDRMKPEISTDAARIQKSLKKKAQHSGFMNLKEQTYTYYSEIIKNGM